MSPTRSNGPDRNNKSDQKPEKGRQDVQSHNQSSDELNRNEERTSPSGERTPDASSQNSELSTEPWSQGKRGHTGNSERSGQQYTEEESASQRAEKHDQQHPNQLDRSAGEFSQEERKNITRGMNAQGKGSHEMDQSKDRKLGKDHDEQSDIRDGGE